MNSKKTHYGTYELDVLSGGHSECIKNLEAGHKNLSKLINWIQPSNSDIKPKWKVKVFDFMNYGGRMQKERMGELFSGFILNSLIKLNLNAVRINTKNPEYEYEKLILEYFPTRGFQPTINWEEYSEYMPFIAIVGFVSQIDQEKFQATVRVATFTSIRNVDTQMVEEVVCSNQPDNMREEAHKIAEKINATIRELTIRLAN